MKKGKGILKGICTLLLCLLCAGCGQKAEDYAVGSANLEYYDIISEKEELFGGRSESSIEKMFFLVFTQVIVFLQIRYYNRSIINNDLSVLKFHACSIYRLH